MYKSDAISHYGNAVKLAEALDITSGSISQWGEIIPEKQALRLEKITNGALKHDPSLYLKAS
ncbi:hypothetical protein IMCC1989_1083 [gamma proteobacterium IMCC1989]|nr:hypothetical protein IMCC1989_1083 [gamma proteobacterium IMCC1989]